MEKSELNDKKNKIRINQEIKILKNSFHYNIIKLYDVIETEESIYIIMEYAEGGDLSSYLSKKKYLTEEEARKIFQQLIDSVYYLHQMGVCHRNLRLENILFSSKKRDVIKVINFGKSILYLTGVNSENPTLSFGPEFLETPFENQGYTPPEMILGCKYDGLLSDLWYCGIILYSMLFGCFPFEDKNTEKLYIKIVKGEFNYPENIVVSEEAKSLINKILVVNPRLRSSIKDIRNDIWLMKDYEQISGLYISIRSIPISDRIIEELEKIGYKKDNIIKDIKNNRHNNKTAFYYLLVNKFRKQGIDTKSDLISNLFKEYLREQDLKNSLIKKGEKPISLKIMKSKSKPIFDIDEPNNNGLNDKVDLNYLKKIFCDYNSEDKQKKETTKNINKLDTHLLLKKKDFQRNINNKKSFKQKKKSKSQTKKIDKKLKNINRDRCAYSTSLTKKNHRKIKEENKIKNFNKNGKIEKDENKNIDDKFKQIIDIKEIIKNKNKTILRKDYKKSKFLEYKRNPIKTHLVTNSISFSKNRTKKFSSTINENILNINNDSNVKLHKTKESKEKKLENVNIKNLSLKNKIKNNYFYKGTFPSRDYLETAINNEVKKGRNYRRKYIITDSASNSKSKSLKTKSNCSTGRGEAIFCKNKSKSQNKNKYLNIKINITKTYTSKKENININKVPLKEKNKIEKNKSKSNSVSKPKKTHIKKNSVNIVNNKKNTVKHNKNINNKNNCTKVIPNPNNCSKDKKSNKKNLRNNSRNKKKLETKERINIHFNSINKTDSNLTETNYFKSSIGFNNNKYEIPKIKNFEKISSNAFKTLNSNRKEISLKKSQNKKSIGSKKIKNRNQVIKKVLTKINNKRQSSNRLTNIRRKSPQNKQEKKDESVNKVKIREIKSIKILNIPINDYSCKTDRNFENHRRQNYLKGFNKNINCNKNRQVLNSKKFE